MTARYFVAFSLGLALLLSSANRCHAELFDSLDAYPPRWQLDTSDCEARITEQKNLSSGGIDGGGCEKLTFKATVGSESILVYPIEPVRVINDLVANAAVMSARPGARIGLRIRFPYLRDPQTHRPVSTILYGASYSRPGKFQALGVGSVERDLRVQIAKLRGRHGAGANLDGAYVDAIAINAYSGPGDTTLRIDRVSLVGMVPVGDHGRVDETPGQSRLTQIASNARATQAVATNQPMMKSDPRHLVGTPTPMLSVLKSTIASDANESISLPPAFPQSEVFRILEHQGEPLEWVRSLGFDAVLLSQPPTKEILREAIRAQLLIYAPPPASPDPALSNLLDPVMAWYLGGGVALDTLRVSQTDLTVRRLRGFPTLWQRPIVIAPVESWTAYAALGDAIVSDASLRRRSLPAVEQTLSQTQRWSKIGDRTQVAIAIASSSPQNLARMNQTIEGMIGAPPGGNFRWHSMLTQVVQSLEQGPRAIVFRSHESLASGTDFAHQRSMALSYVNRFVAMLSPWLPTARPGSTFPVSGAPYRCGSLETNGSSFLLITSDNAIGDQVLAGDGRAIEIQMPPEFANRVAWRLTDFAAKRVNIQSTSTGSSLQIVSPDIAEIIVISNDASLGARLEQSASRFASKAAADRWQLSGDHLNQIQRDWDHAVASGATEAMMPVDLLTVARRTLGDAESVFRANDSEATLRLARRVDAWTNRASVQLSQALLPRDAAGRPMIFVSSPPNDEGRPTLQTAWQPLMGEEGWGKNLMASGGLDGPYVLAPDKWVFGRRKIARSQSDAVWVSRGFFDGQGAVALTASSTTGEPLAGGYEGTIAILSSPVVSLKNPQAIRIDAMVRTIGFGGAHQGLLVYDSLGGQDMGVLVRGASEWTPVRLYRQSSGEQAVKVLFEVIGDGEAVIDEVSVRLWEPEALPPLPLRPIGP